MVCLRVSLLLSALWGCGVPCLGQENCPRGECSGETVQDYASLLQTQRQAAAVAVEQHIQSDKSDEVDGEASGGDDAKIQAVSVSDAAHAGCSVERGACKIVFAVAVNSIAGCSAAAAEGAGTCEVVGGGPEDPFSDICAAAFSGTIFVACKAAVHEGASFGSCQCIKAVKCSKKKDNC